MWEIGQRECFLIKMEGLQKIGYGVFLHWIMLQGKKPSKGGFFVDGFFKEGPKSLEELQTEIADGNTQWHERLCYYSQQVAGSQGYWRAKRAEVYTWINHHIEAGDGPPTFFITLSCAEYMWPDIKRLITDRFHVAALDIPELDKPLIQLSMIIL